MSVVQIPNLPAATSLNGGEQLEAVQSGTSVKLTTSQIGAYVATTYPAPGISSVTANSPLTSTTVTGAVTITLPTQSITNSYLATMASGTVKANITGSSATPSDVTPSAILDTFGTQVGSILYRSSTGWAALTSGTNAQVLTATGTTSAPSWQTLSVPSGNIAPTGITAGTYGSASLVPQFTVLASGQLSSATNVAISIPYTQVTGLGTMATQNASAVAITGGTINGTSVGATTPTTGAFTTFSASGTSNFGTIASGTWNGTAIGVAYGGTGATTAAAARTNLGAAKSGANSDITSLTGLTTPLAENEGGTGYSSYTTGDILYANSSTTLARLNDVATGNALISGGVGVAPSYGKIGLTTHVSGTLPVANGGTGATTLTGYLVGNGTGAFTAVSTIPNAGLTNSAITIGSTSISLGGTSTTIAGLTTLTLTQDPTAALQAATKQYVDGQVSAVSNTTYHTQCVASTTANLTATYSNGTGGVGATLTNSGAQAAFIADGQSLSSGNRVLVQFQSTAAQNGIYTVTTVGTVSTNWVLTRATDFDTVGTGPNYIETGAAVFVTSGSVYGATGWVMNTTGTIVVGTTGLNWTQTSSSSSVTVTSPLTKVGSVISLGTVPTTLGGTGLTTLTQYNVMLGNGTGNVAFAAPSTTGYPLLSTGAASNPAFGQLSLTAGVTGTLPVANGGTGTATAFTTGSVVFAGASGTYSQNNTKLFWDNTNNRLGINTATPQTQLTVVSNTQTVTPTGTLPAGTDIYIVGADSANTRITQDAYGTGNYAAYTGRQARGTAAAPTASQTDDILVEVTGRGYGASAFSTSSVVRIDLEAAENFTNTAQGTYISLHTSALGTASAVERFRIGPSGQFGIGGATYGTSGYVLTSGGASAAPTWSQVSATGLTGVLPVANGGTNISSYAVGDILYASGATTLSKLAAVATGNVLKSGGLVTAPAWGQVSLTTDVTGTLPIANGGTGLTSTPANGALDIGNGTGFTRTTLTAGTNIAITNGAGSISIATSATPSFATSVTTPLVIGGTAASSSLTLQSTSGVGTSDSILFKVGNAGATTAMTIDTSGNVGVGTTTPAWKLDVRGAGAVAQVKATSGSATLIIDGFDGTSYPGINLSQGGVNYWSVQQRADTNLYLYRQSGSGDVLIPSGNVGIGTASPTSGFKLNIADTTAKMQMTSTTGTNIAYSSWNNTGGAVLVGVESSTGGSIFAGTGAYSAVFGHGGGYPVAFATSNTERMRIDSSGRTMIGLAASKTYGNTLQVQGGIQNFGANSASISDIIAYDYNSVDASPTYAGAVLRKYGSTATGNLYVAAAVAAAGWAEISGINTSGLGIGTNGANPIVFGTTSTERMRIDSSGNVGIGTSSPTSYVKLTVNGAIQATGAIGSTASVGGAIISNESPVTRAYVGDGTGYSWAFSKRVSSTTTDLVTILDSGNVGIGFSSGVGTYGQLEVGGSTNPTMALRSSSGSGTVFAITAVGATEARINAITNVPMTFYTNNTLSMTLATGGNLTTVGSLSDSKGNVRQLPVNSQTAAYVLVLADAGKTISITTGGVTVNASIFSAGDNITIFNNSASSQTITQGTSVTIYQAGTANTGNRTLAQRGVCTLLCIVGGATPTFTISGAGLS